MYETTSKFKGCGSVTRKVKPKVRGYRKVGELKEVSVTLYGWKVWAIYEIKTGIPLAIKIDTIEKPDNLHLLAVLEQAKENVKISSIIDSLVIDRGFLDGKRSSMKLIDRGSSLSFLLDYEVVVKISLGSVPKTSVLHKRFHRV